MAPDPTTLEAVIEASYGVNPDPNARPSPIVVRIYELESIDSFEQADFFVLYEQDGTHLGAQLKARDELELRPGGNRELNRELHPQTRHIGVLAAYRDIETARWRASRPVEPNEVNRLRISLDNLAVRIDVIEH